MQSAALIRAMHLVEGALTDVRFTQAAASEARTTAVEASNAAATAAAAAGDAATAAAKAAGHAASAVAAIRVVSEILVEVQDCLNEAHLRNGEAPLRATVAPLWENSETDFYADAEMVN